MKTLADAQRQGAFALDDALAMDPEAWADVAGKPDVGPRLRALAERLRGESFDLEALERATRGLAAELGIKAGELIGITRVALTGRKVSPGIFEVMALLGKERTVARLADAASRWEEGARVKREPGAADEVAGAARAC
jgi:glutamyl/glutaminyl-tRNA synthetase